VHHCSTNCTAHLSTHVGTYISTRGRAHHGAHVSTYAGTHSCTSRTDTGKSALLYVVSQCRGQMWHVWVGFMGEPDGLVRFIRGKLRDL